MNKGVFITGTDTGAGKTWFALGLIAALQGQGFDVCGMKPVACGAKDDGKELVNEDAQAYQQQSSHHIDYSLVNPFTYSLPISAHIAADLAGRPVDLDEILLAFKKIEANADWVVVEGIGGWRAPLSSRHTLSDLAKLLDLPVILVVGMRLGCLNHALLSAEAILSNGLELVGWAANFVDPGFQCPDQNLETLKQRIPVPLLGNIPYMEALNVDLIASKIRLDGVFVVKNKK